MGSKVKAEIAVRERTGMSLSELCGAGRYREASALAEESDPDDPETRLALGRIALYRSSLDRAKDLLTPLAFGSEGFADEAKVYLAHAYYLAGEAGEAKVLLNDADDGFGKFLLKGIMEHRPTFALKLFDRCASYQVRPGMEARLHNHRAQAYRKLGRLDDAIKEYETALDLYERDQSDHRPVILNNLARVYLNAGQFDLAHSSVDEAIGLFQDDPPNLGMALDEKSRVFAAEGNLTAARLKSEQSIRVLRQADRKEWLIQALLTYAEVLRADRDDKEFSVLQEAAEICRYLHRNDLLLDVLKRRHELSVVTSVESEKRLLQVAMDVCGGSYRGMATKLQTTHWRIMRLLKKHGIEK